MFSFIRTFGAVLGERLGHALADCIFPPPPSALELVAEALMAATLVADKAARGKSPQASPSTDGD